MIMEYLTGESLRDRMLRERIRQDLAVAFFRQTASALAAAHQAGIVHRDLKPENIFLVDDSEVSCGQRVKILDFGIAKLAGDNAADFRTRTGMVFGTPAYMSPEQCMGQKQIDHRTDIYSLGCLMFEVISGQVPFEAEGVEMMTARLTKTPPALATIVPDVAPELDRAVVRALARDPAQRAAVDG